MQLGPCAVCWGRAGGVALWAASVRRAGALGVVWRLVLVPRPCAALACQLPLGVRRGGSLPASDCPLCLLVVLTANAVGVRLPPRLWPVVCVCWFCALPDSRAVVDTVLRTLGVSCSWLSSLLRARCVRSLLQGSS